MRQKSSTRLRTKSAKFGLTLFSAIILAGSPALAEILQFSALGLIKRCPCGLNDIPDEAEQDNGVLRLKNSNMTYFMPVALPHGQRVCSFTMVYNDVNQNEIMTAALKRKKILVGQNPDNGVSTMSSVASDAGVPDTVRKITDTTIANQLINTSNFFYYIELGAPNLNLNPIGFQIDVRTTCP